MKLLLVQHGDAVSREIDPERPLSERGRRDVQALAGFLHRAGIRVRGVLHSGKRRAAQTADILAAALMTAGAGEAVAGLAPKDEVGVFAQTLAGRSQDTLVVGHLPFMARLTALLVGGDAERQLVSFRPGSAVCLERGEAGGWQLSWMLRPELVSVSAMP